MTALHPLAAELLTVWFGDDEDTILDAAPRWWRKDPAFDAELRERFGEHLVPAAAGRYADWEASPEGALALIVLLDQISRNVHRGSPASFAQDAAAREVCRRALARGFDRMLHPVKRGFLYMPLMHSEQLEDHAEALARFEALAVAARGGPFADLVENNLRYQRQHTEIIARFGRYPHRNAVLGRETTPEEAAHLTENPGF